MSCDEYLVCPNCHKLDLMVWYEDFINDNLEVDLTQPHGKCRNCNIEFKGLKLKGGIK